VVFDCTQDAMNMGCPDMESNQFPSEFGAGFMDRRRHDCASPGIEGIWSLSHEASFVVTSGRIRGQQGCAVLVVVLIDGPSLVPMEPVAIAAEGNEVCQRRVCAVCFVHAHINGSA